MPGRIEDYAIIGDCETAALVGRDGSIDWLCWPRFDSGACFARLLGNREHGRWLIAPKDASARMSRRYVDGTLVLETVFTTEAGEVAVIDFMPPRDGISDLVRIVEGRRGRVEMMVEFVIRFDYGSIVPWVTREDEMTLRAIAGPELVVLRTPVQLHGENLKSVAEFTVRAGERVPFVLAYSPSYLPLPGSIAPEAQLLDTKVFWQEWSSRCIGMREWGGAVCRSLITLKALTYQPTGGIVAAPTTSVPEELGGPRNWDYRYCWLRDATFTLLALMNAGFYDEANTWRDWLLRAAAGTPSKLQIMYGIAGERRLPEWQVPWLPGYEGSRPVRVGNAAANQLQLDVYGEVMDALYQGRVGGLAESSAGWDLQRALLDHLETIWREPDEGIWEVRGGRRHFTHSKVMAWVAFDRAVKSAETFRLDGPVARWRALAGEIHEEVCRKAWSPECNSFVQAYGSQELDASLLLLPLVGFLPPDDPRVGGTIAAVERHLMRDGLVMRYDTRSGADGLPAGEGAFLACSFWLADNFILLGRLDDARALFERLLALRNDVGLLSEEYDPRARRFLGNFPQAFSHIALVNTAQNLSRAGGPAVQRSEAAALETV
jgi:GH15 family glucan-1,4-alpha-glucosidase